MEETEVGGERDLVLGKDPVDDGKSDSESVVHKQLDSETAEPTKGVREDGNVVDVDLADVEAQIHVYDKGRELEYDVAEAKLSSHLNGTVGFLNPELEVERSGAGHLLVSLRDLEVAKACHVEVHIDRDTRTVVSHDAGEQDVQMVGRKD